MPHEPTGLGGDRDSAESRAEDELAAVFAALASDRRRRLLYTLRTRDRTLSVGSLAEDLAEELDEEPESIEVQLYHVDLPKLADLGLVVYEPEEGGVRYGGGSLVTEVVDTVARYERLRGR